MNTHELDSALAELAARPMPELPGSFRQDVWREIRGRQQESVPSWMGRLEQLLAIALQPQPILASLVLAALVGVYGASWAGIPRVSSKAGMDMAIFGPRVAAFSLEGGR